MLLSRQDYWYVTTINEQVETMYLKGAQRDYIKVFRRKSERGN